jgi:hypothetical protein
MACKRALETLRQTYVTRGHPAIARLAGPRVIRPVFDEAFAIDDLVLGGPGSMSRPISQIAERGDRELVHVAYTTTGCVPRKHLKHDRLIM